MSKIKLLLDVVEDLRSLADSVQAVADAMLQNEEPAAPSQPEPVKAVPQEHTEPPAEPARQIALEEVRAVLAEKSRSGHTAAVKALLQKHGADKLSAINPKEYPALLAEVEVL